MNLKKTLLGQQFTPLAKEGFSYVVTLTPGAAQVVGNITRNPKQRREHNWTNLKTLPQSP